VSLGRFENQVAVVTGASRGIGLGIAKRLVSEGARVCITARKTEALEAAAAELGGPDHAIFVAGSSDDAEHRAEAIARTVDTYGPINLLVNNTGINPVFGPLLDIEPAAAQKIFDVNIMAAIAWTKLAHQASLAEHGGAIVNVVSVAGLGVSPGIAFYGMSKAALINMTRQLAVELSPKVRVNAVAPAVVRTRFAEALYSHDEEGVAQGYLLKRLGEPADIGAAVAFLGSSDASWITGQTLVVDGGLIAGL